MYDILRASREIPIFTAISDTFQSKGPFRMLFAAVTESLASASRADLRFLKRTVIGDTKKWKCAHNYPKCEGKARQGLKNISKSMEKVWRTMGSWIKKSDYQNLVALEDLPSSWAKLPFPFTYEFFQLFGQPRLFIKASLNGSPAVAILKTQLCLQGKFHRRWAKRHLTLLCLFLPSNTKFKIYLFI